MEKLKKCHQNLKLVSIAGLVMITPLISTSLRFKYLYFIVNILIIAVGAEAGLLSFFLQSQNHHNKKPQNINPVEMSPVSPVKTINCVEKAKNSPSNTSIFFIEEDDHELIEDDESEELYQKSEIFIGNFYKQLKMQRQESWTKLHFSQNN